LTKQVYISYIPGSGGNFLRNLLDPEMHEAEAKYWVDQDYHSIAGGGKGEPTPYNDKNLIQIGKGYPGHFTIGLGPTTFKEFIKVQCMSNTKNSHRSISEIDSIIQNIQNKSVSFFNYPADQIINYDNLFNYDLLNNLYFKIHNTYFSQQKQKYFHSYKNKHDKIFSSWQYNVIEIVCVFEYNNNLIEHVSGKMRSWSIDEINEDNWQEFLEEKLCLTNYS